MKTLEEMENETDVLNELMEHHENLKQREGKRVVIGRKHTCPRCRGVTHLQTDAPYCSYCNWDSLEDQANFQFS